MEHPATRAEAQRLKVKFYFTGKPCTNGHVALRKTKGSCTDCEREAWRADNERRADYRKEYKARPEVKARDHDWYGRNKEAVIARAKTMPTGIKNQYKKAWKAKNPEWNLADNKNRRRKHRDATPPWLTKEQRLQMRGLYETAIKLTKTTGVQYVVDHIVPLRHPDVCGLHVPWNLEVTTRAANLEKSNKLTPEAECLAFPEGSP